jgi:hypothetical protein
MNITSPQKTRPSPALYAFGVNRLHLASFFMLVHSTAPTMTRLTQAIQEGQLPIALCEDLQDATRMWGKFSEDMSAKDFHRLCDEMLLCRTVESLDKYLTEMLLVVFLKHPEALKSSETVKIADVLTWGNSDEIVRRLAERKVNALNYQKFDDILIYLCSDLGLPIVLDEALVGATREAIEVRNIIVHNSRVINMTFLKRTKRFDLVEGQLFPLTLDYVLERGKSIRLLVEALDSAFINHFHLDFANGK